jgi:hypothetical protein
MINVRSASAWVLAGGVLLAIGCEHSQQTAVQPVAGTAPSMGVTNRQNEAAARVVERLTYARCEHEQTCNNIGNGRRFATREVCIDSMRGTSANALNAYRCPHGIDEGALDVCLASLRSGQCGGGFLEKGPGCNDSDLCIK